jgi:hypothetical protein
MRRSFLPYFLALLFMVLAGVWSARTGLITDGRSGDGMDYYMPGRTFTASALRAGYLPEWNPYIYTGYSHIGDIQNGFFYPPNLILYLLFSGATACSISVVFHLCLTAFFTSRFLELFVRSSYARWIGAATFTLCGFLACNAVTVTIPDSAAWIPAFFWCIEKWIRTQRWRYCAWGGLCLAMQLFAGWPQMVLLSVVYLGVYLLFALPGQSKPIRILIGIAIAGVIAAALGIPQLIATLQLKNESIIQHLAYNEFSFGSVAPQLAILLFFPFLAGAGMSGVLWHKVAYYAPISGQVNVYYVGILPLMLAVAAIFLWRRSRYVRFAGSAAVLSLVLAWGGYTPLGKVLYRIPIYNFFHDHRINIVFFSFAIGILAACAADEIGFPHLSEERRRRLSWAVPAIVIGVAALLLLHVKSLFRSMNPDVGAMQSDWLLKVHRIMRLDNVDMMLPVALLFVCGGLFCLWVRHPQNRRLATLMVALVIADLLYFGVTGQWVAVLDGAGPEERAALAAMEKNGKGQEFRSMSLVKGRFPAVSPNLISQYHHAAILGLGPFLPKRHAVLLSSLNVGEARYWRELLINNTVLSTVNTRFIEADSEQVAEIERVLGPFQTSADAATANVSRAPVGENLLAQPSWNTSTGQKSGPMPASIPACTRKECETTGTTVHLDPDSAYELNFDARVADVRGAPGKAAEVSGYGGGFAGIGQGQFFGITDWMLQGTHDFTPYTEIYLTGKKTDGLFFLMINFARSPLELKSLSLRKIGSLPLGRNPYRLVGKWGDLNVLENPNVYPRAFFASSVKPVSSFSEARNLLWRTIDPFDARHVALVDAPANELPAKVSEGTVGSLAYSPNQAHLGVSCPDTCYLVLSDMYYPGWKAEIDGRSTPIHLTDAMMRGIVVPAGEHQIELSFHPQSLRFAMLFSLLTFGLVAVITLRSRPEPENQLRV